MKPILSPLITIVLLILNHVFCTAMDNHVTLEQPSEHTEITLNIEPIYISFKKQAFPFSKYHYIFEKEWSKKLFCMNNINTSYAPDCIKNNQIKTITDLNEYFEQEDLWKNYYFLQFVNTLIKRNIEELNLQNTMIIINSCISHKTHLMIDFDIQGMQISLKKAKQKIQNRMKTNIATFIEYFSLKKEKPVIDANNVNYMTILYKIAVKLYNFHKKKVKSNQDFCLKATENDILETFFPHLNILIKNIRQNPSLTTKYNENLDESKIIFF